VIVCECYSGETQGGGEAKGDGKLLDEVSV